MSSRTDPTDMPHRTTPAAMRDLIERHIAAEMAGDIDGALVVYTPDVEHDVVGSPVGPLHGPDQTRAFYTDLDANLQTLEMKPVREYFGADHCTVEHLATCRVKGHFAGVPGNGREVTFRLLHVFEFRGGLISRENVWMDGAAIIAQLTA
jgi:steroid delta-isomerase-like uncharacterized protein